MTSPTARGWRQLVDSVEPDEIYNLAGISSVAYSWEHPALTGEVSGLGPVGVFQARRAPAGAHRAPGPRAAGVERRDLRPSRTRSPQDETTAVAPISPYGAAKAYAHQMAGIFRARGLHVATCILYNHESPLRPTTFVTRKITAAAARIAHDGGGTLTLGSHGRAPGLGLGPGLRGRDDPRGAAPHAPRTSSSPPGARTRSPSSSRPPCGTPGSTDWESHVETDAAFVRPADAAEQSGDASKARELLGWAPTVSFEELVGRMVEHDVALLGGAR